MILYLNPFNPSSAKSKIDKFSKITNWGRLRNFWCIYKVERTFNPFIPDSAKSKIDKFSKITNC